MRVRALAYLVPAIVYGLLAPSPVFAQGDTGRITGRLLEAGAVPWGGGHVTATSASDQRMTAAVDRDGRFEFTGLEPGRYTLTAQAYGGGEMLERALTLSASSVATVDFAFPFDLCAGDVDYVGQRLAESFLGLAAVAHIRVLRRTETEPHGGECGRPLYHYAVAVIRKLQNPSFEGAIGGSIVLSSKEEIVPGSEYVAWLDVSRHSGGFSFALYANEEEMHARVERGRVDWTSGWVAGEIPGLPEHPTVSRLFAALTTFFGVGLPMPSTEALVHALQSSDDAAKTAMVRRFTNRRRGALDGRAIAALSRELEQSADGERGQYHVLEYRLLVLQVLMTQRDPRSIPALVRFVTSTFDVLSQFGGAAVPALVAGLATADINGDGFFRVSTLHAFEQMLTQPAIAATLSDDNRAQIRAVARDLMISPVHASGDREAGRSVLEAAAHLALVTGDPDLRHEVSTLVDNDAAFEARHVDAMWIPLISTHIRKALAEIPAGR